MNDEDIERAGGEHAPLSDGDRPAVAAYDPHFPAPRGASEASGHEPFDPHFPTDGASAFD